MLVNLNGSKFILTDRRACSSQYALRSYWYLLLHTGTAAPAAMLFGDGSGEAHDEALSPLCPMLSISAMTHAFCNPCVHLCRLISQSLTLHCPFLKGYRSPCQMPHRSHADDDQNFLFIQFFGVQARDMCSMPPRQGLLSYLQLQKLPSSGKLRLRIGAPVVRSLASGDRQLIVLWPSNVFCAHAGRCFVYHIHGQTAHASLMCLMQADTAIRRPEGGTLSASLPCIKQRNVVASTALLPSTFAMYTMTAAAAAVLAGAPLLAEACAAIGIIWAWPVTAVAFLPYAVHVLLSCHILASVGSAVGLLAFTLMPLIAADRVFYGQWTVCPRLPPGLPLGVPTLLMLCHDMYDWFNLSAEQHLRYHCSSFLVGFSLNWQNS